MNLELKHLAPYLPYGLKLSYGTDGNYIGMSGYILDKWMKGWTPEYKPILRPLSDLFTVFDINEYDKYEGWQQEWLDHLFDFSGKVHEANITAMPYDLMEIAFENHVDVFGLIEKGLAIDINTLK